MFFALGMERVEARLRQVAVGENEVEEFLEQARPNEVRELFRHGIGRALELFRRRRRTSPRRAPLAITDGGQTADITVMSVHAPYVGDHDQPTEPIPVGRWRAS